MPTLPVDDKGTVLFYEDTGAPEGRDQYTTVVLIHGIIFHGIFSRMFPYVKEYGVRLVVPRRRDYAGSTPYNKIEHERLMGSDVEGHKAALLQEGVELATFLEQFVKTQNISRVKTDKDGKRTGGLAVLGWSSGNLPLLSMLGNAAAFSESQKAFLDDYLQTSIIYDCPNFIFGTTLPHGVYTPIHDTTIPPEKLGDIFMVWVSTYFDAVPELNTTEPALALRSNNYLNITDPARKPTIKRFTEAEIRDITDFAIMERTPDVTWGVLPEFYWENTRRALIDSDGVWPHMKVLLVWCDMSTPDIVWAMKTVSDRVWAARDRGVPIRKTELARFRGGNHFAHWDNPEQMMKILAEHVL